MKHGFTYGLLALAMVTALSACGGSRIPGTAFPRTYDMPYAYPDDAPPEWKKGWEQGCKSGFSAYGNMWYKTLYNFEQDTTLLDNAYYSKSWLDAFNYCRGYINRLLAGETNSGRKTSEIFSTDSLAFPGGDLRDTSLVNKRYGLELDPWYGGIDAPGTAGATGWGNSVPCQGDWLGRKPAGCGWMGQ